MKHLYWALILTGASIQTMMAQSQMPSAAKGTIERIESFESKFVAPRNIDVWLPEGYNSAQEYAVLYMHDGQMLYDASTTWNGQEWGVDETMQRLIDEDKIIPTIVVGIWNGGTSRHPEYFPAKAFKLLPQETQDYLLNEATRGPDQKLFQDTIQSDDYLRFLVHELRPFINEKYSTLTGPEHTFIAGSSMGGLISMYAICEYPEVFSGAACLSTHWPGIFLTYNNPVPAVFVQYLDENAPSAEGHKIYFDNGTEGLDMTYGVTQRQVNEVMAANGFTEESNNYLWREFEGDDHSEQAWRGRFEIPMSFLLKK